MEFSRWKRHFTRLLLHVFLLFMLAISHSCIHDKLDHKISYNSQRYAFSHPFHRSRLERRRLSLYEHAQSLSDTNSLYKPIRITPFFDNSTLSTLSSDDRDTIVKVVKHSIRIFAKTLRVIPVQGNLTASHSCASEWNTQPPVCASIVENETCLEIPIPSSHFAPIRVCSTCSGSNCIRGACVTLNGAGVSDSDYVLYIRTAYTAHCTSSVLAYASACQKEQFDRPTFGMINFCPQKIKIGADAYAGQLSTAMHEITHALGFSSSFFAYMREPNGAPRTLRTASGEPVAIVNARCPNGNSIDYFPNPSNSTIVYNRERGNTVARMTTPRVATFAREHFDCLALSGAEMETQDDGGCVGSHWEERVFGSEMMTPISSYRNIFSNLTLAFLEDTGWYRTNTAMTSTLAYGAKRGCAFALEKCIRPITQQPLDSDHFCTENKEESCSIDGFSRSVCSVAIGETIPSVYQYFDDPSKGGTNDFADFCPLNVGTSFGDCRLRQNLAIPPNTNLNILGESYCPHCKCTRSTLRSTDSQNWLVSSRRKTGCYAMTCDGNGGITITIPRVMTGDTVNITCDRAMEIKSVDGFSGTIVCPDPKIACVQDCPNACAGNGDCDVLRAQCTCRKGWHGVDCSLGVGEVDSITITSTKTQSNYTASSSSRMHISVVVQFACLFAGFVRGWT